MIVFPLGANDDALDALAMQLEFWQTTVSLNERKSNDGPDPLSLEAAIDELHGRFRKRTNKGTLYDVYNPTDEQLAARYGDARLEQIRLN